jgi:hypothetical protein
MSRYDYLIGQKIEAEGYPFYALVQAAMRQADSQNIEKLRWTFPEIHNELQARYNAPGGYLEGEVPDAAH